MVNEELLFNVTIKAIISIIIIIIVIIVIVEKDSFKALSLNNLGEIIQTKYASENLMSEGTLHYSY